ncbi:hypothetical protein GCM10022381_22290 [Leifsonia kafniensis]|uniref:Uncharacterized protein n=1 Tax=Leifsonia kafniensis TaxID=475957 RepID=A0ABP7KJN1_9MICO
MTPIVRIWLAFSAIGVALIHLAVGASAPLVLGIILVGFGLTELGWGVLVLIRSRLLVPGIVLGAALGPVIVWAAAMSLHSGFGLPAEAVALPLFPMLIASLFNLFLAGSLAVLRRRAASRAPDTPSTAVASDPQGWRFLTGLILAGFLVSALTTPALAATDAGAHAVPHGSHAVPGLEFLDGGHAHH